MTVVWLGGDLKDGGCNRQAGTPFGTPLEGTASLGEIGTPGRLTGAGNGYTEYYHQAVPPQRTGKHNYDKRQFPKGGLWRTQYHWRTPNDEDTRRTLKVCGTLRTGGWRTHSQSKMPVEHSGGRGSISGGHLGGKDNGEAEKIRQGTEDEDSGWRTFGGLQAIPEDEKGQIKTSRGQLEPYAMGLSPSPSMSWVSRTVAPPHKPKWTLPGAL